MSACSVFCVFALDAVCSVCLLCAVRSGYWVRAVCVLCAVCCARFLLCFTVSRTPASFTQKLFPRVRIRNNSLSFSSLFLYPGADCTVPLACPFYHVCGNPDLSVLRFIFRVCACCVSSVFLACCVFCVLAECAVRSEYLVRAVCVRCALCAVCGSCCASQQCHAVPHLLFLCFTQRLSPRMHIRYNSLSFSSLFLYPGADYSVPLAFPFYHVYGNPDMSVLRTVSYFPCYVCLLFVQCFLP